MCTRDTVVSLSVYVCLSVIAQCVCMVASSPGRSQFFNIIRWKTGGPGRRACDCAITVHYLCIAAAYNTGTRNYVCILDLYLWVPSSSRLTIRLWASAFFFFIFLASWVGELSSLLWTFRHECIVHARCTCIYTARVWGMLAHAQSVCTRPFLLPSNGLGTRLF